MGRTSRHRRGVRARDVARGVRYRPSIGTGRTGGDGASPTSDASSFPVTIEAANGEVTIAERPERIVSLSPTATEMLFAIDAGDQVRPSTTSRTIHPMRR